MFIYEYEVVYYSDIDDKNYRACGYLTSESYKDATEEVVSYFGDDKIVNMRLKAIAEDNIIIMKEEPANGDMLENWTGPAKNEWC